MNSNTTCSLIPIFDSSYNITGSNVIPITTPLLGDIIYIFSVHIMQVTTTPISLTLNCKDGSTVFFSDSNLMPPTLSGQMDNIYAIQSNVDLTSPFLEVISGANVPLLVKFILFKLVID